MTRQQVRLDEDVAEALRRAAERAEHSVTVEANAALRRALGVRPTTTAGHTGAQARAPRARCVHPAARRVKGQCMACGAGGLGTAR